MTRRIDFAREFVFGDDRAASTPAELAALVASSDGYAEEVCRRFLDGDLMRWLRHVGYEQLAVTLTGLRAQPTEAATLKVRLQGILSQGVAPAVPAALAEPEPTATASVETSPHEVPDERDLVDRQRAAIQDLLTLDRQGDEKQERVEASAREEERAAEATSGRARAELQAWVSGCDDSRRTAAGALGDVSLTDLLPLAPPEPTAIRLDLEARGGCERSLAAAREATVAVEAGAALLKARRLLSATTAAFRSLRPSALSRLADLEGQTSEADRLVNQDEADALGRAKEIATRVRNLTEGAIASEVSELQSARDRLEDRRAKAQNRSYPGLGCMVAFVWLVMTVTVLEWLSAGFPSITAAFNAPGNSSAIGFGFLAGGLICWAVAANSIRRIRTSSARAARDAHQVVIEALRQAQTAGPGFDAPRPAVAATLASEWVQYAAYLLAAVALAVVLSVVWVIQAAPASGRQAVQPSTAAPNLHGLQMDTFPQGGETPAPARPRSAVSVAMGTWEGTVKQPERAIAYGVVLNLMPGADSLDVGTSEYPDLGCTYGLRLMESGAREFTVRQSRKSGRCVLTNTLTLAPTGADELDVQWHYPYGGTWMRATLRRRQSGAGATPDSSLPVAVTEATAPAGPLPKAAPANTSPVQVVDSAPAEALAAESPVDTVPTDGQAAAPADSVADTAAVSGESAGTEAGASDVQPSAGEAMGDTAEAAADTGPTAPASPSAPAGSVAGFWKGSSKDKVPNDRKALITITIGSVPSFPLTFNLTQSGTDVSGTSLITVSDRSGRVASLSGIVTGRMVADSFTGEYVVSVPHCSARVAFVAEVKGKTMKGKTHSTSDCRGAKPTEGSFKLKKSTP